MTAKNKNEITLLNHSDAAQVERLLSNKSLDYLSHWETGEYHALDADGELLNHVKCSDVVAKVVNAMINRLQGRA